MGSHLLQFGIVSFKPHVNLISDSAVIAGPSSLLQHLNLGSNPRYLCQ
jgi:hypothetical protein